MVFQDVFELKYAKMPDSAGEDSEVDSNAGTSLAAHSDDDNSTAAEQLASAASHVVEEVTYLC